MNLNNQTVIITGGSSGLGKMLAKRFWERGANLALIARSENKLITIKENLCSKNGHKVEIFPCDVTDYNAVEETIKNIVKTFGKPDVLVNSAGILYEGYFENQSLETFHEVMNSNYFGVLHGIKAVLPFFQEKKGGTIINICSVGGLIGTFGYAAYCSSKFAIQGLSEVLRLELKPQNIKVHLVCPPEFEGPMVDGIEAAGRTPENRELVQTLPVQTVDKVADEVMRGIDKGKYKIITGSVSRWLVKLNGWVPKLLRSYADKRISNIYIGPGGI